MSVEAELPYGPLHTVNDQTPTFVVTGLVERAFVPAWVPALLQAPFFIPQLVAVPKVHMPNEAITE